MTFVLVRCKTDMSEKGECEVYNIVCNHKVLNVNNCLHVRSLKI